MLRSKAVGIADINVNEDSANAARTKRIMTFREKMGVMMSGIVLGVPSGQLIEWVECRDWAVEGEGETILSDTYIAFLLLLKDRPVRSET